MLGLSGSQPFSLSSQGRGSEPIKNKAQKSDVGVQCVKIITDKSQVLGHDFGSVTTDPYPGIQLAHAEQSPSPQGRVDPCDFTA